MTADIGTPLWSGAYAVHVGPDPENMVFGMELVLDLENCEPGLITHSGRIRAWSAALIRTLQMKAYGPCQLWHFGHDDPVTAGYTSEEIGQDHNGPLGVTGVIRARQLIETSSIVAHFSPALRRAHLNVFSCRRFDPSEAERVSLNFFGGFGFWSDDGCRTAQAVVVVR